MTALTTVSATEISTVFDAEVASAQKRRAQSTSESTKRNYSAEWKRFTAYCLARDLPSLPTTPEIAAVYLNKLFDDGLSISTVDLARASIIAVHKAELQPFDNEHSTWQTCMRSWHSTTPEACRSPGTRP
jgi:hypothetical protein